MTASRACSSRSCDWRSRAWADGAEAPFMSLTGRRSRRVSLQGISGPRAVFGPHFDEAAQVRDDGLNDAR